MFRRARDLAHKLLVLTGAHTPDRIDPIASAKELGIEIAYGALKGAKARISWIGTNARIRVSDQIITQACARATITHEVGHHVCGHELARDDDAESWLRTSCDQRARRIEREADVFAVEHLTPEHMVLPYCRVTPVDLHAVREIERVFRVSPVLAALRLMELSMQACAIVYSENGVIRWMRRNRAFPLRFAPGTEIAIGPIAERYFGGRALSREANVRSASTWLCQRANTLPDVDLVEHSITIPEPGWGGVMSLLWIPHFAAATATRMVPETPDESARQAPAI